MKKLFLAAVMGTLLFAQASAQQTHFGLKAGVNVSTVPVTDDNDLKSKAGLHLGGFAHIHVSPHFAVQPELVYSMQGGKRDNTTLRLNYINVPVLAQYMTNDGFRLQTGPQVGFLTSSKTKTGNVEINQDNNFSAIDFSWAFGASYLLPSADGLGFDLRYNVGISNISDNNGTTARNNVLQLGIFYQFMHSHTTRRK
jgi:Outer membrane protein beta-barrel domain